VQIAGFETCGSWFVEKPQNFNEHTTMQFIFRFGQQVTAAMPLEGIQALFVKAKSGRKDTLLSSVGGKLSNMHQVRKEDFSRLALIKPSDINDEFLGFFSMVVSYAKAGPKQAATDGPKMALPLMPRTDHLAIYTKFIRGKLGDQLKCDSLYQIVKLLAAYKGDGSGDMDENFKGDEFDKAKFKWDNGIKGANNKKAELLVSDWMKGLQDGKKDLMAEQDKIIDGQIGKLGDRMEYLYQGKHDRLVPIFEFRDLGSSSAPDLKKSLVAFEDAVVAAHKEYSNPPKKLRVRDPEIKRDNKCPATTTNKPPPPPLRLPPPPPPPTPPPPPPTDICGDWYKIVLDYFEIRGKNFDATKFGTDGSGLEQQVKGCGELTKWHFEYTPNDPRFAWFAKGQLPIGTKACVGRAVVSAGGEGPDGCTGAG